MNSKIKELQFLDVAKNAAFQAGKFLLENIGRVEKIEYKSEGHTNPVSEVDEEAENIILSIINNSFPEHNFISEEKGIIDASSDYTWIIDPLDGTINFIHNYEYFGVSISLSYQEDIILGVVYNPLTDEIFTAVKGNGAYLNGRKIQVSKIMNLEESLLATGFSYDHSSEVFNRSIEYFIRLLRKSQAIRRDGSAALDLCNVGCRRYDGFWLAGGKLWDWAAGILIVTEAGGKVTDFKGEPFHIKKNEVLATNGKIHDVILKYLKEG
jgi:myo-inositol-1(or 4)-monophosphatase